MKTIFEISEGFTIKINPKPLKKGEIQSGLGTWVFNPSHFEKYPKSHNPFQYEHDDGELYLVIASSKPLIRWMAMEEETWENSMVPKLKKNK